MWDISDQLIWSYFKLINLSVNCIKISMHRLYAIKFIIESISEKPLKYREFDFRIVSPKCTLHPDSTVN